MKSILCCISLCLTIVSRAQESIGSAGGHLESATVQMSINIGEPVIATATAGNTTLTQGFEQPWADIGTWVPAPEIGDEQVLVYPNPARHELFIVLGRTARGEQYTLLDAAGKLVASGRIEADIQAIGMESIASGNYQLVLRTQEGSPLGAFGIIINH